MNVIITYSRSDFHLHRNCHRCHHHRHHHHHRGQHYYSHRLTACSTTWISLLRDWASALVLALVLALVTLCRTSLPNPFFSDPLWWQDKALGWWRSCYSTLLFKIYFNLAIHHLFIHSFIPDNSLAPLHIHYYSEALLNTALIPCRS